MTSKSAIWVTWEYQTRNRSLSGLIDIPLYEIVSKNRGGKRYAKSLLETYRLIRSKNPGVVFCQNPSIVLSFFCVLFRKFLSYSVIVDEHNAGLFPLDGRSRLLNWIARFIVRRADAVIVTNAALAKQCAEWGGDFLIIEDPLPEFANQHSMTLPVCSEKKDEKQKPFELFFVCTWASDEPYLNVLLAARAFSNEVLKISITGNYKGKIQNLEVPNNVYLTGFLTKSDYVSKFSGADGVLVLTTREACLNCGAYEAVSLRKPGILSDTHALRSYFSDGFLFTDNSVDSLIQCFKSLMDDHDALKEAVSVQKAKCEANDLVNRQKVKGLLAKLAQ